MESLPVAAVVRRSIGEFVRRAKEESLPEIRLDGLEDRQRRGSRGPVTQWPLTVSYVLDADLADDFESVAAARGETVSDAARAAIGLALATKGLPDRPMTPLSNGFVTKSPGRKGSNPYREVLEVRSVLRKGS